MLIRRKIVIWLCLMITVIAVYATRRRWWRLHNRHVHAPYRVVQAHVRRLAAWLVLLCNWKHNRVHKRYKHPRVHVHRCFIKIYLDENYNIDSPRTRIWPMLVRVQTSPSSSSDKRHKDRWLTLRSGWRRLVCWFLQRACVVSVSEYIKFSDNQALPLNKAHKFYGSFAPKARKRSLCKLLFLVNTANFTRKRYTRLAKWNKKHNCVVITVLLTSLQTCGVIDELGWQ